MRGCMFEDPNKVDIIKSLYYCFSFLVDLVKPGCFYVRLLRFKRVSASVWVMCVSRMCLRVSGTTDQLINPHVISLHFIYYLSFIHSTTSGLIVALEFQLLKFNCVYCILRETLECFACQLLRTRPAASSYSPPPRQHRHHPLCT